MRLVAFRKRLIENKKERSGDAVRLLYQKTDIMVFFCALL